MLTEPPEGVNLRALSAKVFTMKSVKALSAFTRASLCAKRSSSPFFSNTLRERFITCKISFIANVETCNVSSPCDI